MSNLFTHTVTIITKDHSSTENNILANSPVEIRYRLENGSSGDLAVIYEDSGGLTEITQPASTNSLGQFTFFAESKKYNAVYNNEGIPVTQAIDICVTSNYIIEDNSQVYLFETVSEMVNSTIVFTENKKLKTTVNNTTTNNGGAEYIVLSAANYTAQSPNPTPDGELVLGGYIGADFYLNGGTDLVAKLLASNTTDISKMGASSRITKAVTDKCNNYIKGHGGVLVGSGTYYLDEDVWIDVNFDFTGMHLYSDYTFHVGKENLHQTEEIEFYSPSVIEPETDQLNAGFQNSTGLLVVNLEHCVGHINTIGNNMVGQGALGGGFEVGFHFLAKQRPDDLTTYGVCSNNKFFLNYLNNNRVNLKGSEEAVDWDPEVQAFKYAFANENLFVGGTFYHRTQVTPWADCHHILLEQVSANTFFKPNLEEFFRTWATLEIVKIVGGFNTAGASLGGDVNKFFDVRVEGGDPDAGSPLRMVLEGCLNTVFEAKGSSFGFTIDARQHNGIGVKEAYTLLSKENQYGSSIGVQYPEVVYNQLSDERPLVEYISGTIANKWDRNGLDDDWTGRLYSDKMCWKNTASPNAQMTVNGSFARRYMQIAKASGNVKVSPIYAVPLAATITSGSSTTDITPEVIFDFRDDDGLGLHKVVIDWVMKNDQGNYAMGRTSQMIEYDGTGDYTIASTNQVLESSLGLLNVSVEVEDYVGSGGVPAILARGNDQTTPASPLKISGWVTMSSNFTEAV